MSCCAFCGEKVNKEKYCCSSCGRPLPINFYEKAEKIAMPIK